MASEIFPDFRGIAGQDPEAARALSRPLMTDRYEAISHEPGEDREFPPETAVVVAAVATYLSAGGSVESKGVVLFNRGQRFEHRLTVARFVQEYRVLVGAHQEVGRPSLALGPVLHLGQLAVEGARRSGEPVIGSCYMVRGVPSGKFHTALMIPRSAYELAPAALQGWLEGYRGAVPEEQLRASAGMRVLEAAVEQLTKIEDGKNLGLGFVAASMHMPPADALEDMLALKRN